MKKHFLAILVVLCLPLLVLGAPDDEAEYKANFIIKLFEYVEWPANAATGNNGEFLIYVVGESPLMSLMQTMADEASVGGKTIAVKQVGIEDDFSGCRILFMTATETSELAKILKKTNGNPILTVSQAEYFGNYGVMVNFYTETDGGKNKVKFEINNMMVKDHGLKISSKLLKLAKII